MKMSEMLEGIGASVMVHFLHIYTKAAHSSLLLPKLALHCKQ